MQLVGSIYLIACSEVAKALVNHAVWPPTAQATSNTQIWATLFGIQNHHDGELDGPESHRDVRILWCSIQSHHSGVLDGNVPQPTVMFETFHVAKYKGQNVDESCVSGSSCDCKTAKSTIHQLQYVNELPCCQTYHPRSSCWIWTGSFLVVVETPVFELHPSLDTSIEYSIQTSSEQPKTFSLQTTTKSSQYIIFWFTPQTRQHKFSTFSRCWRTKEAQPRQELENDELNR